MTGSSSTWYATSARLRTSRSSAARFWTLEVLKELLGGVDDRVGLLSLEAGAIVDLAPRHGDRVHAGGLCRTDVERRVADVGRLTRVGVHPARRKKQRLRVRLVPLGLVAADNRLEKMSERHAREGELDRRAPLRGHDPEPPPLLVQADEYILHAGACLELAVQRLVVRAIDAHELVDAVGSEHRKLRLKPRAADRLHQLGVLVIAPAHLAGGVTHRGQDDRARVADGAVALGSEH